ncbi:hypothetical protein C4564_00515 [Candidatus Microgenomates bacterium]|nr:MAG: hypothetical protein C4564_00515 [Candidatus Microgenomates bacterium]
MKKAYIILFAIFLLALFIRSYKLGSIPQGFYNDESMFGYEAYSILKTGKDQFGNVLPVTFQAFGDYRPGLFIYTLVPFIQLLGLTEFATRFPAALFSALTVFPIFFIADELFKNKKAALLTAIIFTLSAFSIVLARISHETNLATFLVSCGIAFLLRYLRLRKNLHLFIALCFFAVSVYAYYTPRVFVPLFLAITYFLYIPIKKYIKTYAGSFFLTVMLLLPMLIVLTTSSTGWSRVNSISIWGDAGIQSQMLQFRHEDVLMGGHFSRLFHNKITINALAFTQNFLVHFDPYFLFFNGDPNKLYSVPGIGILYFAEALFLVIGVYFLISKKHHYLLLLGTWFILGILPDALTRLSPAAPRIHLTLPLVSILAGFGLWHFYQWGKKLKYLGYSALVFVAGIFIFQHLFFLQSHFVHAQVRLAKEWHYGVREAINYVQKHESDYGLIWSTKQVHEWINYAFYLKYPPEQIQKEIQLVDYNEYGLGWVYGFGKYRFTNLPSLYDFSQNILYVADIGEFPPEAKPLHVINYPDGSPAYAFMDTSSLQRDCPECDIYTKEERAIRAEEEAQKQTDLLNSPPLTVN